MTTDTVVYNFNTHQQKVNNKLIFSSIEKMGDCCSTEPGKVADVNTLPPKHLKPSPNIYTVTEESLDSKSVSSQQIEEIVGSIEYQWKEAVKQSDNLKIRSLFKSHHKKIKFFQIRFENGDTSLHYAARKGNVKLVKFFLILQMNVCFVYSRMSSKHKQNNYKSNIVTS